MLHGLLENRYRHRIPTMEVNFLKVVGLLLYCLSVTAIRGIAAQESYVEPYGDNVCSRITSVRNVQRIPMSGVQTKRFRYMTKCSVFGVAMCSRYRIVYVNAFRELVSTQYSVRPGCCAGYVQDGTMCIEAPPTTSPPRTTSRFNSHTQTVLAPFNGLGPRGTSSGFANREGGGRGNSQHEEGEIINQEGGYFEVNPDYKGPAVDKVLPLIASGVAGVVTLTAVVAIILLVINRRKRRRNKVQPGFHDNVRFRTQNQPKGGAKLEMNAVMVEKPPIQSAKPNLKQSKKSKKISRKDGPYVEIADIPGTQFSRVTSTMERAAKDDPQNNQKSPTGNKHRRSLNESNRLKKNPMKRGGSMKCIPQYAVVNKLKKNGKDCEKLMEKQKKQKKNNNEIDDELHGAYHAFTLDEHDKAPLYADPNQKSYKSKSKTWNCRVGASLIGKPGLGIGTIAGNMFSVLKETNLRETSKIFTSCDGLGQRLSSDSEGKDDDSGNSSGYSSLRHSIDGDSDQYGKLNHGGSVKPPVGETKSNSGSTDGSDVNDYDKLRRGPKSRIVGTKWATSGHYETLDANESL